MGLLTLFVGGVVHLAVVMLDIAIAFCIVTILRVSLSWDFLQAFEEAGKPITEKIIEYSRDATSKVAGRSIDRQPALAVGMVGLLTARFALVSLFNALFSLS